MYNTKLSLNEKCSILDEVVRCSFLRGILCHSVTMSSKDKPYVTPMIKYLINLRCDAYRRRHFPLYIRARIFVIRLKNRYSLKS